MNRAFALVGALVLAWSSVSASTGYFFFLSNKSGIPQVWRANADGSGVTQITTDPYAKSAVSSAVVMIDGQPVTVVTQPFGMDLFGRLRTSNPENLFESTFLYSKKPLLWDELVTIGGTSTFNSNKSQIDMAVSVASGSRVVRQTKEYFIYQPGRAELFSGTTTFASATANCNQYLGMLDDNDGVFFGMQGVTFGVGVRTSTSGSPSTTFVPRTSFNIDKLDGTGPSGMTLDLTKSQLLQIEYEWFGVGTVRWGIDWNGTIYYVHQIHHVNTQAGVYMKRGALPIRYEIANAATISAPVTMSQICANVSSEGGYSLSGIRGAASNGVTAITVGTTLTPILSIRLTAAYNRATMLPESAMVIGTGADNFRYQVLLNPTLTGASFVTIANSAVEYDQAATVISGGYVLDEGYGSLQTRSTLNANLDSLLKCVANIAGTTDILTLAVQHVGAGNVGILGALGWKEFR